jgi:hypothetical protein
MAPSAPAPRPGLAACGLVSRQQKMVHAADSGRRVEQAGGDAGAENGGQHHVGVAFDMLLTLHDVDAPFPELRERFGHFSAPSTASIFCFSVAMVKGLIK